ncbi:MAG: Putaive isomerase [uncultured Sphingomonas sp.]|uniref:Putaive isomerase n=1 Tax=uncultured Sphingomonas sp. TaxID=158754 RepID=A0A6J4S9E3_9SPHN|nr:sugar phosphate isomerase/epimerase family protein [uncultured Sphingomonas sp.]CAA9493013.1 MAG: Putaive isomerase [uncultured Sphingomonas sp.]
MSLRIAYNTNGASSHRLDDAVALIADCGYQGVALTLDHHHLDPFAYDWQRQVERLRERLNRLDLGTVIETGARYLLDSREKHEPTLLNPSPEGRARRVEFLCRAIDIAAKLGSETVSFWAGVPKPQVDREQAMTWLHEGIAAVCDHAGARSVAVSLEPEPGMLVETVADYDAVAQRHPALRLALDTGHCLVAQDIAPDKAVRQYADALGTVSIEDMKVGDHTHLPFGEGDMDVGAVVAALTEIGFDRLVCVEYSRESPRAHAAIPEAIAYLRTAGA